jgi:hypothetical protein
MRTLLLILVADGHAPVLVAATPTAHRRFSLGRSTPENPETARRVRIAATHAPDAPGFWVVDLDQPGVVRRASAHDLTDYAYGATWVDVASTPATR